GWEDARNSYRGFLGTGWPGVLGKRGRIRGGTPKAPPVNCGVASGFHALRGLHGMERHAGKEHPLRGNDHPERSTQPPGSHHAQTVARLGVSRIDGYFPSRGKQDLRPKAPRSAMFVIAALWTLCAQSVLHALG